MKNRNDQMRPGNDPPAAKEISPKVFTDMVGDAAERMQRTSKGPKEAGVGAIKQAGPNAPKQYGNNGKDLPPY